MKSLYQNLDFSFTAENIPIHILTIALCRQVAHVPFHSHGAGCYELHYIASGKGEIHLKDGYFHTAPIPFIWQVLTQNIRNSLTGRIL